MVVRIGIIVLAAGASTRMGQPKQLLACGKSTLLGTTLSAALKSECDPVIVVLGANVERIRETVPPGIQMVYNECWPNGLHTSIAAGLAKLGDLHANAAAAIFANADQPYITDAVFRRLVAAYRDTGKRICASAYAKTRGTPALFDASLFPELSRLSKGGARTLFNRYPNDVAEVPWPEGAFDLDTPADYRQFSAAGIV